MKKILFIIAAWCITGVAIAQPELPGKTLYHYVLPAFSPGTVLKKSGEVSKAQLNYNTLTEEMIFENAGRKMALDKTEEIDTVYILDRKFVPSGNMFYEMATSTPVPLFITYKSQIVPPGSNTGFGMSQTSAINNISNLRNSGLFYQLKLPDDYKLTTKTIYQLKKNGNLYIIKNSKDVQDRFLDKTDAIKEFVKANKISFKNTEDVVKLINFCN